MKSLLNYFNEEELKFLLETNPNLSYALEIDKLIQVLIQCDCNIDLIKHIILSNPKYLTNDYYKVVELINKLNEIGLTELEIIFESYPYLLNKYGFEIDDFVNKRLQNGSTIEEIRKLISSNPSILDEE